MKLLIILPVHNRKKLTVQFIHYLLGQTFQDFHVLLVDDGSTDGTANEAKLLLGEKVTILRGSGDWWWGGSLHKAYEWIISNNGFDFKNVLIMNDDVEIEPNFLEAGSKAITSFPNALIQAIAANKLHPEKNERGFITDWPCNTYIPVQDNISANCFSTRGLISSIETFINLKGFYPKLIPHYGSDYEFTQRAYKKGHLLLTDESFFLYPISDTTGIHSVPKGNIWNFLKVSLSKRYTSNPLYQTTYLLISCPMPWKILNILKVWRYFFVTIIKILYKDIKN